MKHIIILVGPPGSGKSTLAKQHEVAGYIRINQDEQGKSGHLLTFDEALASGKNIIIDRMNFNKQQRAKYLEIAKLGDYRTSIHVLQVPKDTCLERCIAREQHPTIKCEEDALRALNTFFRFYERPAMDEADYVVFLGHEKRTIPAIWCDIDNTLSDGNHKEHFLKQSPKDWEGFFAASAHDPVNEWCKSILVSMHPTTKICIVTARSEKNREITETWLKDNNIPYHHLFMRPANDYRGDAIIKEIILDFELFSRYNLLFSLDDRKSVIDMARSRGVTVLDCAGIRGDF